MGAAEKRVENKIPFVERLAVGGGFGIKNQRLLCMRGSGLVSEHFLS